MMTLQNVVELNSDRLADLYATGSVPSMSWLGERVGGQLIAAPTGPLEPLTHPLFSWYARYLSTWEGKSFSDDGSRGFNRIRGHDRLSFSCAKGISAVDGRPTLHLDYNLPENAYPKRILFDEVRRIDDRVALGAAFVRLLGGRHRLMFWFALEAS